MKHLNEKGYDDKQSNAYLPGYEIVYIFFRIKLSMKH